MAEVGAVAQDARVAEMFRQALNLARQGALSQADHLLVRVIQAQPDHVEAHIARARLQFEQRRPDAAYVSYSAALAVEPDHLVALHDRGAVLMALGRHAEALADLERVIALRPDAVSALYNAGVSLAALGRHAEAAQRYRQVLAIRPGHVLSVNNLGASLLQLGQMAEAAAAFQQAQALAPNDVSILNNLATTLRELGRHAEMLQVADRGLALAPGHAQLINSRGMALAGLGRLQEALAAFDAGLAAYPENVELHENRSVMLVELGRTAEAGEAIRRAVAIAPGRVRAYYNLTEIRRTLPGEPHLEAMETLARSIDQLPLQDRIELHFALGKAHADVGDFEQAFQRFTAGGALQRARLGYDEAATFDVLERTAAAFSHDVLWRNAGKGDPSDAPVFILGMPRSGGTLVEQILASHPEVHGAGETDAFRQAVADLAAEGIVEDSPEGFAHLPAKALRRLGQTYLERVGRPDAGIRRVTDKSIEAFRLTGLIHMALPGARFIHVRRDPLDACLSCFSKLFVTTLGYTYDLGDLGRYWRRYEAQMAHWAQALPPGAILEVRYEDVVADLEGQARRMLAHCGLDWDERVLDFHTTDRAVRTASFAQVRQPIYASSVGRWRDYAPWLGPLKEALGQS